MSLFDYNYNIEDFVNIKGQNETDLEVGIVNIGPISFSIYAWQDSYEFYVVF